MAKSYYAILGLSSNANTDEIRAAYRRLAKEFHPDRYPGGSDVFQQIQEAYSVLSDAGERREYDRNISRARAAVFSGRVPGPRPEPLIPEKRPVDFGDISVARSFQTYTPSFDEIFDWLWSNFSILGQPKSGRMQNLTLEITLTAEQAMRGGNARVMVPARAICPACHGSGGVGPYECSRCAGEGAISGELPISVSFPPGLMQDHAVVIPLQRFGIGNTHLTILFRPSEMCY